VVWAPLAIASIISSPIPKVWTLKGFYSFDLKNLISLAYANSIMSVWVSRLKPHWSSNVLPMGSRTADDISSAPEYFMCNLREPSPPSTIGIIYT